MSEEENKYTEEDIESRNEDMEQEDEETPLTNPIDIMFEQILLNYIAETTNPVMTPSTYYYERNSRYNNNEIFQHSTTIYSSMNLNNNEYENIFNEIDEYDEEEYNGLDDSFFSRIVNRIIDPIENVLNRSLEEQPSLEKNKEEIDFESVKYETVADKKEKKCCICLADFCDEEDVTSIKCKHLFHKNCIKEWSTYNITCPVCRTNLKEE